MEGKRASIDQKEPMNKMMRMTKKLLHGNLSEEEEDTSNTIFLDEGIMQEIFLMLPIKSLLRCKSLSKISHSLISSTSFMQYYQKSKRTHTTSLMLGFFYQPVPYNDDIDPVPIRFIPSSSEGKKLMMMNESDEKILGMPGFDESLGFLLGSVRSSTDPPDVYVLIVASSHGFLLCRKEPVFDIDYNHYYVCNPITKQWVSLPKPPNTELYAILEELTFQENSINAILCLSSVAYKVIRCLRSDPNEFSCSLNVEIFSSKTGEWIHFLLDTGVSQVRINLVPVASPQALRINMLPKPVISERGTVCMDATLSLSRAHLCVTLDLNRNEKQALQMIILPGYPKYIKFCYWGVSEGHIHFIQYNHEGFMIWELNEDETKWIPIHEIYLQELFQAYPHDDLNFEANHPLNPTVVLVNLFGGQKKVLLDLKNRSMELISEFDSRNNNAYRFFAYQWPFWPPRIV